jgi:hypothetical protein
MHFILIHGYNDRSAGANNLDKLRPYLEALGHTVDCDSADYGWFGLFWVRFRKHSAVLRIVKAIQKAQIEGRQVVVVGYSNGANYALRAVKLLTGEFVSMYLIHPALPSKAKFPAVVSRVWVAVTKSDWIVRLATFTNWLTGWGRMGRNGYRGDDERVKNLDYTDVAKGHGGTFEDEIIEWFAGEMHREVTS